MFVGHYSAAFLGKAIAPRVPLWLLFLGVQVLDVIWAILVLLGVEKLRILAGSDGPKALDLYYMPYTHSLVGALAWSALAFALARWIRVGGGSPRAAGILALAVLSHWFLDVVVHGPDLPIYDDAARVGFGLWSHTLPAFLVEVGFLGGSIAWCLRSRQVAPTLRRRGIVVFGGVLLAVQAANSFGPIPTSPTAMVSVALCSYVVFAAVVYRLERRTCPALSPRDFRESAPARDH